MGIVTLPCLEIKESLINAVRALKIFDCSAVVAREGDDYWIFTKEEVLIAYQPYLKLSAIPTRDPVYVGGPELASKAATGTSWEELGTFGRKYALLAVDSTARILTQSETYERKLGARYGEGPSYRFCTGNHHPFPDTGVAEDGTCELDGTRIA